MKMDQELRGLRRCPHCGIASPSVSLISKVVHEPLPDESGWGHGWAMYRCNSCRLVMLAQSVEGSQAQSFILTLYPSPKELDPDLPERVRTYLMQATESLHAPDGAAMLAGAAVDAMLKEKGFENGSVYHRIDEALKAGVLTHDMAEWAHDVRLGSNRPRHSDSSDPHVRPAEAKQAVEFAEMLGHFLFVLPARVQQKAKLAKSGG